MLEDLSLLFWCLFPLHFVIPTINVIFQKVALTTWIIFCWWFRQEKKVDWAGTGCESDLNIVSYAHTCSIVWMSVIFVIWQYYLLDRLVTWQCWSGNFGLGCTESGFESLHVLPFEKLSGELRSGDLASQCGYADSTVRCWGTCMSSV